MRRFSPGIRGKLIIIFILIKVLPLIGLAWLAWREVVSLGDAVENHASRMIDNTRQIVGRVGDVASRDSIRALDLKAREAIERLTTDTARQVAAFLSQRDQDALLAAKIEPNVEDYKRFLASRMRVVVDHEPWVLDKRGAEWGRAGGKEKSGPTVAARVEDNKKDFHSRPPERVGLPKEIPLYLEMTFVGLDGREKIKVVTSDLLPPEPRDVSNLANTWCKAENYFNELKKLKPGQIYVSEVIGPYVPSRIIGPYTKERAEKAGIPFEPENAGYAGKENPVGKRFQGLVRWASPVVENGRIKGWVTLALDHTHIMEFTDHVVPTAERYSPISDAASGNYAFMWDHKDRCISHPRDYFIVGYDSETGKPAVPWLSSEIDKMWRQSGLEIDQFMNEAPLFLSPSLSKRPAPALTRAGLVGLDCRYLNFAPQCAGWNNLTQYGGSGSFVIFWSNLWKLTTAAAIPYYTGMYSQSPRGFGYVTIGANVREFHRAATETAARIDNMVHDFESDLDRENKLTKDLMDASLSKTARDLTASTAVMIAIVIAIAVWMASTLTRRITGMIGGVRKFQGGDLHHRLEVGSSDEMGQLAMAFNDMSDSILSSVNDLKEAERKYREIVNNAVDGIFQSLPDGQFISSNPALARMLGFDSPEALMSGVQNIGKEIYLIPEHRQDIAAILEDKGRAVGFETRFRRRDGGVIWVSISARAVRNKDGKLDYYEGMIKDVTRRKMAEAAMQRAKEEAEAASRMKSDFLSMVSHELRTPLTSVLGFAKIIEKKLDRTIFPKIESKDAAATQAVDQISRNLSIIVSEGERLTHLINDVLDLSKLESGKMEWHMEPLIVSELIDRAMATSAVLAAKKGLVLTRKVEEDLSMIWGDRYRLIQVLINLLSNAIKFTGSGSITCRAENTDKGVLFSVADTGVGIPEEFREAVFDRFRQIGDILTEKPKGTGLGLPICREIVVRHGGQIWQESNPDGGSIFYFLIPVHQAG